MIKLFIPSEPASPSMPTNKTPPTVLVVDDDDFFHALLGELFAGLGVTQVLAAKNGNDALKLLKTRKEPVDFLVCDVFMPDMDGIEFLNHLVTRKFGGAILMASGVDIEMLDLARTIADANGLRLVGAVTKPVSADQLGRALDAYYALPG